MVHLLFTNICSACIVLHVCHFGFLVCGPLHVCHLVFFVCGPRLLSNLSMKKNLTMVVTMMLGIQCEVTMVMMVTMLVPSTISCNKIEAQSYIVTFAFVVVVWIMINEACSFCYSWSLIFIYYYFCVAGIKNGRGQYLKGCNRTKLLYSSHATTTNTNTNTHKHTLRQASYQKTNNNTITKTITNA